MKVIELTDYEINDLIRILDYAIKEKQNDYKDGIINLQQSQYEIDIIRKLKNSLPNKIKSKKQLVSEDLVKIM